MVNVVKAVVIPPSGKARVQDVPEPDGLDALQALVGGNIEAVRHPDGYHGYINDEGKLNGLPYNSAATQLFAPALFTGDYIAGTIVLLSDDGEGGEADCPQEVIDLLARFHLLG